jgi:hypothetical protein
MDSVSGGLDIRDNTGASCGSRKPIASGHTKNETLPISSIILTMSERPELNLFLQHWEEMTGEEVTVGGTSITYNQAEPFFPKSFFDQSRSKRALPFSNKSLRTDDYKGHLSALRKTLPANPGDLLWLLDRFLEAHYPNGGDIDMASSSECTNSVYGKISAFCAQARYKHHPHIRTLKAFVDIAEMGQTERAIAKNALEFAWKVLRTSLDIKSKTLPVYVDGVRKDTTRKLMDIGSNTPANVIRPWSEPKVEATTQVGTDVTDDEVSDDEGYDESDDSESSDEEMKEAEDVTTEEEL